MNFTFFAPDENSLDLANRQQVRGVMIGTVTNNQDPEGKGRVKVKLFMREGEMETDWIRVATMMTGSDYGTLFLPEVEDEVVVAFHLGDVNHPIVIGSLWNSKRKNPAVAEQNNVRKIKTRSGHELIFDDGEKGYIEIITKKGNKIRMDEESETIKITDKNDKNFLQIDGKNEKITLTSGSNKIIIDSSGEITCQSQNKVNIKGAMVSVTADSQLELKANGGVKIESGALVTIKGSMVKIN